MNPAEVVESYLAEQGIDFVRGEDAWSMALSGARKKSMPVVLSLRERTLALESFFMRRPLEAAGEVYRMLLARNARPGPVRFAADADGDVYIAGEIELEGLDADALDRLLGAAVAVADELFDAAVAVGFASYRERERAWRERGVEREDGDGIDEPPGEVSQR